MALENVHYSIININLLLEKIQVTVCSAKGNTVKCVIVNAQDPANLIRSI